MEEAVETLGNAFLRHPGNQKLRQSLLDGALNAFDFYRQLLCAVYRIALLLEYGTLPVESSCPPWASLSETVRTLRKDPATHSLGRLSLQLDLCRTSACADLEVSMCENASFQRTVQLLLMASDGDTSHGQPRAGRISEWSGAAYEALLAYRPCIVLGAAPEFRLLPGGDRKQRGSYYTPGPLVEELIRSTLVPVLRQRLDTVSTWPEKERALLTITVCDPACGVGHFLLAAARCLATELAAIRGREREPDVDAYRAAFVDVLASCIHGVDRDPLAVDLAIINLWRESGGHLALWDLRLRLKCGDSLIGLVDLKELRWEQADRASAGWPLDGPSLQARCDEWAGSFFDSERRFFHWPLEFPEVMAAGGFDVVLTNPPWELLQPEERAFFAAHGRQDIADLPGAERKAAIRHLEASDPALARGWKEHRRSIVAESRFLRRSGRFRLSASGKLNLYSLFVETIRATLRGDGRAGCVVPSGLVTDDTVKGLFQEIVNSRTLVSLLHFDNRARLFADVGSTITFCLLTLTGRSTRTNTPEYAFFLRSAHDLAKRERRYVLSQEDIELLNPNTRTCPTVRSRREVDLLREIYHRVPVFVRDGSSGGNPWGIRFRQGLFNMTADSPHFRSGRELQMEGWMRQGRMFSRGRERYLPLYEAKMFHHFDHRWRRCDFETVRREDASASVEPRYWVPEMQVERRLEGKWDRAWLLALRLVCRSTDERTVIGTVLPCAGYGNSALLLYPSVQSAPHVASLLACLSSYAVDYIARQKLGGINLNFHILRQLPILPPCIYDKPAPWSPRTELKTWLGDRVMELVYTSSDLAPFALDLGYGGAPFVWKNERRLVLRCELDAAFFHLYGLSLRDVDFIMDTFPIRRRKEERCYGEYRSKRLILEQYEAMQGAIRRWEDVYQG